MTDSHEAISDSQLMLLDAEWWFAKNLSKLPPLL